MWKPRFALFLFLSFAIFLMLNCKGGGEDTKYSYSKVANQSIDSLLQIKNYFAAREAYNASKKDISEFHRLKAEVFLHYAFNKPDLSIQKSKHLFARYSKQMNDSISYSVRSLEHINHSRNFEYKLARKSLETLLDKYSEYISLEERQDLENTLVIWSILEGQDKQQVVKHKSLNVPIIKDKAGLQNLTVSNGNSEKNFIFDTGANISTITNSTAKELGMIFLDGSFNVNAITGQKVKSSIGIAPQLFIGDIEIQNVIFLIFPDEALAFPQIDYQIEGILGFPVLEALDEIQITQNKRFIVPVEQSSSDNKNLAIDFLTPLVWLEDSRGKGVYTFDTGASNTILYNTYYESSTGSLAETQEAEISFGGAGGHITRKGIYTTFSPRINKEFIAVDSVIVLKEAIQPENKYLGNIGQDLIEQFSRMTINFDQMFLKFDQ